MTEGNKREYVNLIARHRMTTSIRAQVGGEEGEGQGGEFDPAPCSQLRPSLSAYTINPKPLRA